MAFLPFIWVMVARMWAAHGERDVPDAVPVGQMGGLGACADSAAVCCTSAIVLSKTSSHVCPLLGLV